MHKISMTDREQYIKALDVLIRVGGTFQGRGPSAKPYLLVTDSQYQALLKARVVKENGAKVKSRGKTAK